jgi:hypothetical protein
VRPTDWQAEVATLNGVNLPWLAMCEALDVPVTRSGPAAARPIDDAGAGSLDEPTGWRSSLGFRWPAGLGPPGLRLRDGYFRLDDPLPGLYYYVVESFARRARRRLARLFRHERAAACDPTAIERSAPTQ